VTSNLDTLKQYFSVHTERGLLERPKDPAIKLSSAQSLLSSRPFCTQLKPHERQMLLLLLLDWDFRGEGRIYQSNLLRMVRAATLVRVAPGSSPVRPPQQH